MGGDASDTSPREGPEAPTRGTFPPPGRLLYGVFAGVALVVLSAGVVWLWLLGRAPPPIAASLPADIDALAEVTDVRGALASALTMAIVEADSSAATKSLEALSGELAAAFELAKEDAESLLGSVAAVSVVVRNVARGQAEDAALISFTSESAVDALLASPRFRKEGAIGGAGQLYLVETRPNAQESGTAGAMEQALSLLAEKPEDAIAWFAERRLLALGDRTLLADVAAVIEEEKPNLAEAPVYARASEELSGDQNGMGLFDLNVLKQVKEGPSKALFEGYLKDVGPIALSVRLTAAGVKMEAHGHLAGEKLPKTLMFEAPAALDLADRLPAETVGYLAFSTQSALDGAGARALLVDQLRAYDARGDLGLAGDVRKAIGDFEQKSGLSADALFASLGAQGVVSVALARDFQLDPAALTARPFGALAVTYLQAVSDKGVAASAIDRLRLELEEGSFSGRFIVKAEEHGFAATPKGGERAALASVRASLEGDHLVVAFGASALVERAFSAFREGKEALRDEAAHKKARAQLGEHPQILFWFDSGRAAAVAPSAGQRLGTDLAAMGLPFRFRTTGDDRITLAAALSLEPEPSGFRARVEALNLFTSLPATTAVGAARALSPPSAGLGRPAAAANEEDSETIGIEACDEYVRKMPRCIDNMPAPAQQRARDTLRTSRETWLMAAEGPGRTAVRKGCQAALDSLPNNPFCR